MIRRINSRGTERGALPQPALMALLRAETRLEITLLRKPLTDAAYMEMGRLDGGPNEGYMAVASPGDPAYMAVASPGDPAYMAVASPGDPAYMAVASPGDTAYVDIAATPTTETAGYEVPGALLVDTSTGIGQAAPGATFAACRCVVDCWGV